MNPRLSCELIDALVPENGVLVVLAEVFVDETNTHDGPEFVAIAGYIFYRREAKLFSRKLGKTLKENALPYFHMVDCVHNADKFKHLSRKQCDVVARRLIYLTRKYSAYGFVTALHKDTYNRVCPKNISEHLGSEYSFCLRTVLTLVKEWAARTGFDGRVSYHFENGADHQSEANRIFNQGFEYQELRDRYLYASHAFVSKEDYPPLGSADCLAWLFQNHDKKPKGSEPRADLMALLREEDQLLYLDEERLTRNFDEIRRGHPEWFDGSEFQES